MAYFENLETAKKFAKDNVTNGVNLRGYNLRVGTIDVETPIGPIRACVGISGSSGLGTRKPTVSVLFKDLDGGRHAQAHLQEQINKKLGRVN